jgi:hypothetical protein
MQQSIKKRERHVIWFPDGVWEHIRSYMDIWKYPYNKVIQEIPKINGDTFRVEYFKELPIPKRANPLDYMLESYSHFPTYRRPINRMYMVKEIRPYPFFTKKHPLYSIGTTREYDEETLEIYSSENPIEVFKKKIHTHWLAAGQDLGELGIKI